MPDAEPSAIDYFAAELKAQRAQRGWTQVELGKKIGYSGSFVSDVERGDRLARLDFAQACDREFGTPGTFVRWHEMAKREAYPSFFAPIIPFEQEAVRIHGWEIGAVPGLLQTEEYARALIEATRPQDSHEAIERLVTARIERQEVLRKDNPPRLWYVVDEGVVRRIVGSHLVMAGQLDRLISSARTGDRATDTPVHGWRSRGH